MSLFAALEGAIAHGKFDEMKSFYGPESQAYFNADPAVTSMPESGSAVGPEAIAEAARSEFGGKTVHFNIATLFHQTASTGAPLLVATGKVHIGTHKFPFSHTVLLAPASEDTDSTAFYVRNEILTVTGAGVDLVSGGSAAAAAAIAIDDSSEEPAAPAEDVLQVEGSATAQPADTGARLPAPSARLPAAIHPKPSAAQAATEVTAPSMGGFEWDNDTARHHQD
ncbi:hypothetical protein FNF29_00929 [Cafeteria roenbergensis]|uniref:NTF2 domain-containing protein n=1 Tax=Cafeteria roenbergensis TaxID=33653 RepID=A0A5A8DSA9_CAFRO|nr:hypothetical protein FNF29_00929 [Cafeteria roenbergensis]KAA0167584.1 hypothetical protein FNF28_02798 [Cafeteria roenbergensis]|eukprot:KAA0156819.1 hypothetical protein FNF29_00929 [Cafeteria roenbergensis]